MDLNLFLISICLKNIDDFLVYVKANLFSPYQVESKEDFNFFLFNVNSAFLKYGFGSLSLLQWALEVSSFHSNIKTSVTFCSLVFSKVYFGVCSLYSTQKCSLEFAAEVPDRQKQIGAEMTTQPSFKSDIKEFAGCKSVPFSSLLFYFSVIKYAVYLVS